MKHTIEVAVREILAQGTVINVDVDSMIALLIHYDNETHYYAYARGYNEGYKHGESGEDHAYPDTRGL